MLSLYWDWYKTELRNITILFISPGSRLSERGPAELIRISSSKLSAYLYAHTWLQTKYYVITYCQKLFATFAVASYFSLALPASVT